MKRDDIAAAAVPRAGFETLCGRVPRGTGEPALFKSARSQTWGAVLAGAHCDIAIDGWFVLDGLLLLGRSVAERDRVTADIERDLDALLRRIDNGFFNIVVHDRRTRSTRIANDRFGGLPIYLHDEPGALVFASSVAGLLEMAAAAPPHDPVGLAELYWFGYQLGERTAFRGVQRLAPGSVLEIDWHGGRRTLRSHAEVAIAPAHFATPAEASDHLAATMHDVLASLARDDAVFAAKLSAGMDSRFIAAAWPQRGLRSYTFGHPASKEVGLAAELAAALGSAHTTVPLQGDFFSTLHAPLFARQGIVEWFHQALVPAMQRDGVDLVLDGLAGDVLVGGLTLKRSQSRWRQALGMKPDLRKLPSSPEGIARYLIDACRVPDAGYRPMTRDAIGAVNAHWDAIAHDMVGEVERARRRCGGTLERVCSEVIFNNRTRRHVSLQGTVCRPEVETLYPFLDRRFIALMGAFPSAWIASKRLYVELFSRHYPQVQRVPSTYSMLPFTASTASHLRGRVLRYALERLGGGVTRCSAGRFNPWVADSMQWWRWLAFEPSLQGGALGYLRRSSAFDAGPYRRSLVALKRGAAFSGTRFMYTASYLSYFMP